MIDHETSTYLDHLSEPQREAVEYISGPALVIAGAGSGKTRVLVAKVIHLLRSGLLPQEIMALTFTNKAAREMKERIAKELGIRLPWDFKVGTFHSVFLRILRQYASKVGLSSELTIYDTADQKSLVKLAIKELQLDDKVYTPKLCLSRISSAKNRLIDVQSYAHTPDLMAYDAKCRVPRFVDIYSLYQARIKASNAIDFDDILVYTNILLRDFPKVRAELQAQTKYLLIDEYQDTNFAQYMIAHQLMGEDGKIFAVGDDAQSIYSFRGANIDNILNFQQAFPNTKLFKLEENYRSTQNIVRTANRLIKNNRQQIHKDVFSSQSEGCEVEVYPCYTDITEAVFVAEQLSMLHMREHIPFSHMAVLYRTNAQSRLLEQEMRKKSIPFRIYGGLSFFSYKEIKDVMAYLKLIVNPNDEEAIYRSINYPRRGIGDTTIAKLRLLSRDKDIPLGEVIASPALMRDAQITPATIKKIGGYAEMLNKLRAMPQENLVELTEAVIAESGIYELFLQDKSVEGISCKENIRELLSGISQYQESEYEDGHIPSLANFLNDMALITDQDKTNESEAERVTLMTIHSAKGLEFPVVYIVGLEEDLFPSSLCTNQKDLEEERRLLYVAITRAKERCVITFAKSRYQAGRSEFRTPSRFIRELSGEGCGSAEQISSKATLPTFVFERKADRKAQPSWKLQSVSDTGQTPQSESRPRQNLRRIDSLDSVAPQTSDEQYFRTTFTVGDRVIHSRFGIGVVTAVDGQGENARASVLFETVGQKLLLLRFAKLIKQN